MKTSLTLALLAASLLAAPVAAQDPAGRSVTVRYADLDLSKASGVSALDRRIRAAVRTVCGTASDVDVHGKNLVRQCRADTLDRVAVQRAEALALAGQASPIQLASRP